ncbi:probable magnesium transporter NIPA3 isoform X2 [Solanum dulcamara]|uniref:probable magnesium transporter NIPA3 isoform X2 n=1 Tax=Solanum dulcamara TaxID=45834 RepID=UPI0024856BB4|nr:probable magnesium transporter NIPA3 isoform X2 [Solanum dulcamara]
MGSSQQAASFGDSQQISSDNVNGLCLALSSSLFIGSSFIIKKKGLQKAAASGLRAGSGGYSYLMEPLWWAGMITMIVGEVANFAAYAFAPAVLVTPLGALSIIISAVLAHMILGEKLHIFGIVGCVLCVVGSTTIVLHAPQERQIESVKELWDLATEPAFLLYATLVIVAVVIIIVQYAPKYGQTHIIAYIGVCSLVGSIGVMSVQALGIALKLTFSGTNQLLYPQTWVFAVVVVTCVFTQMNYLNKDWNGQTATQIITELCGFVTILSGTFLLHKTKDLVEVSSPSAFMRYPKYDEGGGSNEEGIPLKNRESMR